jgi:DNA polymerase-4
VGGRAETRGVIATCNYEARAFGVHSAMPTARALQLCPQLVLLPPDFERYREASRRSAIYHDYTALVEPLSLDEAYLDVSGVERCRGSASLMAQEIRARIRAEVGITASAGIAPNKFIAKVASDWNKPDGQFVVRPQDVDAFVAALPVKKIFGVGKVTAAQAQRLGVNTCADLRAWSVAELTREFGSFGASLHHLCRGIDERAVQVTKLFVKLKFADFQSTTVECAARQPEPERVAELLGTALGRSPLPVRLLGIGVRFVDLREESNPAQLELFESDAVLT